MAVGGACAGSLQELIGPKPTCSPFYVMCACEVRIVPPLASESIFSMSSVVPRHPSFLKTACDTEV